MKPKKYTLGAEPETQPDLELMRWLDPINRTPDEGMRPNRTPDERLRPFIWSGVRLGLIPSSAVQLGLILSSAVRLGLILSLGVRLGLIGGSVVNSSISVNFTATIFILTEIVLFLNDFTMSCKSPCCFQLCCWWRSFPWRRVLMKPIPCWCYSLRQFINNQSCPMLNYWCRRQTVFLLYIIKLLFIWDQ